MMIPPPEPAASSAPARDDRRWVVAITPRTLWLTAAIAVTCAGLLVVLVHASGVLLLVFTAIILGEALRPLVAGLGRAHLPRAVAVVLLYLLVGAALAGLGWLLVAPTARQVGALLDQLPETGTRLQAWGDQAGQALGARPAVRQALGAVASQLAPGAAQAVPALLRLPANLLSVLVGTIVVLTMTLFWVLSADQLRAFLLGLVPAAAEGEVAALLTALGQGLGGYVRGILVNMLVIGTLTGLGLLVLGLPYVLLVGLLTGLTEIIPYLGPWISGSAALAVALVAGNPFLALKVLIFYLVLQQVEGETVVPLVMSRAVALNPLTVTVATLIGGAVLGLAGAILAVPLATVIQIVLLRVLAPAVRRAAGRTSASPGPPARDAPATPGADADRPSAPAG